MEAQQGKRQEAHPAAIVLLRMLEQIPDANILLDGEGRLYFANAKALKLGDFPVKSIPGFLLSSALAPESIQNFRTAIDKASEGELRSEFDLQLRNAAGVERSIRLGIQPMETDLASSLQDFFSIAAQRLYVATLHELDDGRRFEDKLLLVKDEEAKKRRTQELLLSTLLNEISTPIHAILNLSSIVLKDAPQASLPSIQGMAEASRTLQVILNEIEKLVALEQGRERFEVKRFASEELAKHLDQVYGPLARHKGLNWSVRNDSSTSFEGDLTSLEQALDAILEHSLSATESGRIDVVLSDSSITEYLADVVIEIRDTGSGLSPRQQELIDEQINDNSSYRSTRGYSGLSLVRARRLIRMLGGQMYFETFPAMGTTFHISVPMHRLEEDQVVAEEQIHIHTFASQPKVLIAEDSEVNQILLEAVVEKAGCTPEIADTGSQALELLTLQPFALVLMDLALPELDGIEIARRIRNSDGPNKKTPILAISAHSLAKDRQLCLEAGMDDFIAKPFDPKAMLSTILSWLTRDVTAPT